MKKIIFVLMLMLIAGDLTAQGLTRHGEITNSSTVFVDKNGKTGSTPALNKSGAVRTGLAIGDSYGGGKVAYILKSGDPGYVSGVTKGLIAANSDQSAGIVWAKPAYQSLPAGATATALGTGSASTDLIVAQNGAGTDYAAGLAHACTDGGYSDWFLPSQDELNKLYDMKVLGFGDFTGTYYWNTSETGTGDVAGYRNFTTGASGGGWKGGTSGVRAIRSFAIGALTSIAAISGTANVGVGLSAGALSPSGATATYQWTICSTVDGTYTNISGATSNNYTTVAADLGKFIKIVATGSGGYTGTVTSAAIGALAAIPSTTIGTQTWTTKNLDVTSYRDGTTITYAANATEWATANTNGVGAWCYYNNSSANGATYGKLYNWVAVNNVRGLAPTGWHVASNAEWTTLATTLGGDPAAAQKLKEVGSAHWPSPNTDATDAYGFTALPGGFCEPDQVFKDVGAAAYWWTSTLFASDNALYISIFSLWYIGAGPDPWGYGFPVRCVKD